ncbi:MAG: acyl--CoA ligase, partial [Deltaproteobacteria bacterium]|nr:acyl--CoA ligase [Deltaproteobacteria bacterium]
MSITHHPNTAGHRLLYFGREYGERLCVTSCDDFRSRRYTYAEMLARTVQTASLLLSAGCRKGDPVMVIAENSVEYVLLLFASGVLGLRLVPVDFNTAPESVRAFAGAEQPRLVFTSRADVSGALAGCGTEVREIDLLLEEGAPHP